MPLDDYINAYLSTDRSPINVIDGPITKILKKEILLAKDQYDQYLLHVEELDGIILAIKRLLPKIKKFDEILLKQGYTQ